MHNYTPLVIIGNDKNKQKTLQSQRKLPLTARNTLFAFKIIGAPKNFYKWPHLVFSLYLGLKLSILYRYHISVSSKAQSISWESSFNKCLDGLQMDKELSDQGIEKEPAPTQLLEVSSYSSWLGFSKD